jgi:hypothetical protein
LQVHQGRLSDECSDVIDVVFVSAGLYAVCTKGGLRFMKVTRLPRGAFRVTEAGQEEGGHAGAGADAGYDSQNSARSMCLLMGETVKTAIALD